MKNFINKKVDIIYLLLFIVCDVMLITGGLEIKIFLIEYSTYWGGGPINYLYILAFNLIILVIVNVINLILLFNKKNKIKFKLILFIFIAVLTMFITIIQDNTMKENNIIEKKYYSIYEIIKKPFK